MILEGMAKRAQEVQLARIRREAEVQQERVLREGELDSQQFQHEQLQLSHRGQLVDGQQAVAEKEVRLLPLTSQLKTAELELEERKGRIAAGSVAREVLAKGAHERRMQESLLTVLPGLVEHAARPMEKIGEIKVLSISGNDPSGAGSHGGIASIITALPFVREVFGFVQGVTQLSPKRE